MALKSYIAPRLSSLMIVLHLYRPRMSRMTILALKPFMPHNLNVGPFARELEQGNSIAVGPFSPTNMQTSMWSAAVAVFAVSLACLAEAQSVSAPAPSPAVVSTYRRPNNSDCVSSTASSLDYFPLQFQIGSSSGPTTQQQINVTVAQDFTVQYMDSYKVVTNLYVNETYVLYQCGTGRPSADVVPQGSKFFEIPLTSVSVIETVPYAYMQALDVVDRVYSLSSYTVAACGQLQVACTQEAPPEEMLYDAEYLDPLLANVDGIMTSTANATLQPQFAFSASTDPGALNRAEWLKFMGLFFNLDDSANTIFNQINSSYYTRSASYKASNAGKGNHTVAWIALYETAFQVSFADYKLEFVRDAGGNVTNQTALAAMSNVTASEFSSSTVQFAWGPSDMGFANQTAAIAAFHRFLSNVDVVVDETYVYDPTTYNLTDFMEAFNITGSRAAANASFPFLRSGAVYREDGLLSNSSTSGIGLDWFEGAYVRPDNVLSDVAHAINSSSVSRGYKATWLRNLATNEQPTFVTPLSCTTPASGISVVASSPTGAPAAAPSLSASSSGSLTSVVEGNTTTLVSCPASAARNVPTICPFVKACGETSSVTLTNSTGGICRYTPCTA